MKSLKYIFIFIFLFVLGCTTISTPFTTEYNNQMFNSFSGYYNTQQFDSICITDSIEHDINHWIILYLKDDETKENISQYLYIKSLGKSEQIYRLQIINDSTYKITKRITK